MSAGGLMVINAAYYRTPAMVYAVFPSVGSKTINQVLGPIDIDNYYGGPNIDYRYRIRAVLNLWGGPVFPISDQSPQSQSNFFASTVSTDNPPFIGFHGFKDPVFPFEEGPGQNVIFSPPPEDDEFDYNSESRCLLDDPFVIDGNASTPDQVIGSSLNMYNIIQGFGKLVELYVDCDMFHGMHPDTSNDFGIGPHTLNQRRTYIVQRAATFFQAVLAGKTPSDLGRSLFIDCENFRKKCDGESHDFCNDISCDDQ